MKTSLGEETQDRRPPVTLAIDRVGVEGLKVPIALRRNGSRREEVGTIDVKIKLDGRHRGVHMSRLVQAVYDATASDTFSSFEELGRRILRLLNDSHPSVAGEVQIANSLVMKRKTPVTGKASLESYDISTKVIRSGSSFRKLLTVKVIGNTLCPHSLELSAGKAHAQRAEVQLGVLTDFYAKISHEGMITVCEQAFSSPTYSLVKTEDELFLVDKMYSNPKFVEDVARDCYRLLKMRGIDGEAHIRVSSYESIHKHIAVSEIIKEL